MRTVIDANVLIVANRPVSGADAACIAAAATALLETQQEHVLLEDTADLILAEYKRYCSFSGQPGPGDRFFVWFMRNRWTKAHVVRVDVGGTEAEVTHVLPPDLRALDRSDHKWVAVYLAGAGEALFNAVDSDYREQAPALAAAGVSVVELCEPGP